MHSRVPVRDPLSSPRNAKFRLQWCRESRHWTSENWKRILGSKGLGEIRRQKLISDVTFNNLGDWNALKLKRSRIHNYELINAQ
ncbi:hypothetical protein TNCV_3450101 [Trichonephila clavipes]|uniref:Uncharacterized protein n=1 Tax=Trichonephila clavipes TaxID=2585209 RepID=A0A8X6WJJ0_TRICX|nr:hypothetical protein TNCV_3450101 [Trichonephila clavipes]